MTHFRIAASFALLVLAIAALVSSFPYAQALAEVARGALDHREADGSVLAALLLGFVSWVIAFWATFGLASALWPAPAGDEDADAELAA